MLQQILWLKSVTWTIHLTKEERLSQHHCSRDTECRHHFLDSRRGQMQQYRVKGSVSKNKKIV